MKLLSRLLGDRGGRAPLKRVSPEKAKAVSSAKKREVLPQAGEKLTVLLVCIAVSSVLIGSGAGLGARAWTGLVILLGLVIGFYQRYLFEFRRGVLRSLPRVLALAGLLLASLATLRGFHIFFGLDYAGWLPLSLVSLVIALVWNRRFALENISFLALLHVLYFLLHGRSGLNDFQGLAIALSGAAVAALAAEQVKRRATLVRVGLVIGLAQMLVASTFILIGTDGGAESVSIGQLVLLGLHGLVTGLLVSGLLPAIESFFHVTTDISLLELGNTHEQPLLRKLLLEAPGTFHHSYIVGLLSEEAAEAVGGDALLARVGALYHDIGKLNKPDYFAENSPEARARHRELTPEMSLLIISAHTRDGIELGQYYGLPKAILDFMTEHHGTLIVEYFYEQAKKIRGEDKVSEDSFRYAGPRPRSIETAIVMLADAVEAISRQMPEPSRARLKEMVHEVAFKRLMQQQFEECPMTLADLARVEEAFLRVLMAIYHQRPTFPKGRPHPLDMSQPSEQRKPAKEEARARKASRTV